MTAPRILGIPAAAHREALLRETAGGGRVPLAVAPFVARATYLEPCHADRRHAVWLCPHCGGYARRLYQEDAPSRQIKHQPTCELWGLILHAPRDPEAGATGLARLAWVAMPAGVDLQWGSPVWRVSREHGMWFVRLDWGQDEDDVSEWGPDNLPALRDATNAAHAIALVCVHLGLLDRVEVVT